MTTIADIYAARTRRKPGKAERLDAQAELMRANLPSPRRQRYRTAMRRIADYHRQHACFVCGMRGACNHREPRVVAAVLGIPQFIITGGAA